MRSAEAAIDDAQNALTVKCEELLSSEEWMSEQIVDYEGTLRRLDLIVKAGLPPVRVIPLTTLTKLGRIPRSTETDENGKPYANDARDAIRQAGASLTGTSNAILFFYSHRWKRPNWCEALQKDLEFGSEERTQAVAAGHTVGDVDDAQHTKAQALIEWGKWFIRDRAQYGLGRSACGVRFIPWRRAAMLGQLQAFIWIDWLCADQTNLGPDMAALPATAGICHAMLAAWSPEYADRAWCRVELMMNHSFCAMGSYIFEVEEGFTDNFRRGRSRLSQELVKWPDPADGKLTNEGDRSIINDLRGVAAGSTLWT